MTDSPLTDALVQAAERYCAAAGIKVGTLGLYAVGNSRLFASLKAGRPCLTSTLDRVQAYMAAHPVEPDSTPARDPTASSDDSVNAQDDAA